MSADTKYMHPNALQAFKNTCKNAGLTPVIVQTWGNAPESNKTHETDGHYGPKKIKYCAATDISVNQLAWHWKLEKFVKMTDARIKWFLWHLSQNGFVAWFRRKSQGFTAQHIHAIYVGVKMKASLAKQCLGFFDGRTGLKSNALETYWTAPEREDAALQKLFHQHN